MEASLTSVDALVKLMLRFIYFWQSSMARLNGPLEYQDSILYAVYCIYTLYKAGPLCSAYFVKLLTHSGELGKLELLLLLSPDDFNGRCFKV